MSRTKKSALRPGRKRKRDETDEAGTNATKRPATTNPANRSRNDRPSDPSKSPSPENNDEPKPQPNSTPDPDAAAGPALLADHFAKHVRRSFPDSSPVELEEQYLSAKAFADTSGYEKERLAGNLPHFLTQFSKGGKDDLLTCQKKASPHTIVITLSGMRTADLHRELRVFQSADSKVGKLIAKHMKLDQNIKFMRENNVGIAIATPFRFKQLVDAGGLKTTNLCRIVVDGSYRDSKRHTIFTMDQTFQALVALLNHETIRQRYGLAENKTEILVF